MVNIPKTIADKIIALFQIAFGVKHHFTRHILGISVNSNIRGHHVLLDPVWITNPINTNVTGM